MDLINILLTIEEPWGYPRTLSDLFMCEYYCLVNNKVWI